MIAADDLFQIVGGAIAALAPLHIDDGAERTLERTAAAEIEAGQRPQGAAYMVAGQHRCRLAHQIGQVGHEIVERFHFAAVGIAQHHVQPMLLSLAGEQADAQRLRVLQIVGHLRQHRQAAGNVEAPDADRHVAFAEAAREVDGARVLVRLHADHGDEAAAAIGLDHADDLFGPDPAVGFVEGVKPDIDVVAETFPIPEIGNQAVEAGHGVRGDCRPEPLNGIAVAAIVRRLDHDKMKDFACVSRDFHQRLSEY